MIIVSTGPLLFALALAAILSIPFHKAEYEAPLPLRLMMVPYGLLFVGANALGIVLVIFGLIRMGLIRLRGQTLN